MKVRIDPAVYILGAFMLLAVPLEWLAAWLIAAALHEAGHILAVRAFGGRAAVIRLGIQGALIDAEDMGTRRNIAACLAGPVIGALPLLLGAYFPRLAICAGAFSACNLLPVFPLDGGRAMRLILERYPNLAVWIEHAAVLALLTAAWLLRTVLPVLVLFPYLREKYLAKRRKKGYNSATIEMR